MKIISELKYYQMKCMLLENVEKESPCDPDITSDQIIAYKRLNKFKKDYVFKPNLD
jgi:hypothetical protein